MKQGLFDQPDDLNPDRLHEELKAALGDKYDSVDTGVREKLDDPSKILVRVSDDATEADNATVDAIIKAHDHTKLSTRQQKTHDRVAAYTDFVSFDFVALRAAKPAEQTPIIIDLLEKIQKLMQGTE